MVILARYLYVVNIKSNKILLFLYFQTNYLLYKLFASGRKDPQKIPESFISPGLSPLFYPFVTATVPVLWTS